MDYIHEDNGLSAQQTAQLTTWINENLLTSNEPKDRINVSAIKHQFERSARFYVPDKVFRQTLLVCGLKPDDPNKPLWMVLVARNSPVFHSN